MPGNQTAAPEQARIELSLVLDPRASFAGQVEVTGDSWPDTDVIVWPRDEYRASRRTWIWVPEGNARIVLRGTLTDRYGVEHSIMRERTIATHRGLNSALELPLLDE